MSIPQKKLREAVFQLMYGHDFSPFCQEEAIPVIMEQLSMSKKNAMLATRRVRAIVEKWDLLDAEITKASSGYTVQSLGSVERTILRLALFEVLFDEEIPNEVALSEALRLCKKFAHPESTRYIHAVISAISEPKALAT